MGSMEDIDERVDGGARRLRCWDPGYLSVIDYCNLMHSNGRELGLPVLKGNDVVLTLGYI